MSLFESVSKNGIQNLNSHDTQQQTFEKQKGFSDDIFLPFSLTKIMSETQGRCDPVHNHERIYEHK